MATAYLELNRHFVERPKYEPDEIIAAQLSGKRLNWDGVLESRASIVIAPANFGKTTEMQHRAEQLRISDEAAVFVALRRVLDRGSFTKALDATDLSAYRAWKKSPFSTLTIFVDSLDEASAAGKDSIEYLVSEIVKEVTKPNRQIRWIVSTRPAVLTADLIAKLTSLLTKPLGAAQKHVQLGQTIDTSAATTSAVVDASDTRHEKVRFFSLVGLDSRQGEIYLAAKHPTFDARALLQIARERGLSGFTTSPGGLDVLAHIDLTIAPPDSLTEVFQRAVNAVQELQRQDHRAIDAGNVSPLLVAEAAQKLASASQVCTLPNIEIPQERLGVTDGVLSARLVASSILTERALNQLLNSQLFIDVGYHQVKLYPDELLPFLGAQRLAALVQSPDQAHQLVQLFTWKSPTGEQGVYRHYLPLMGWLATLSAHCREEILECDPQAVAFFGDLRNHRMPIAAARTALRESIRRLVENGDRLGRQMFNLTSENYWQAGRSDLLPLLRQLFKQHGSDHRARDVLLDIATAAASEVFREPILKTYGNYQRLMDQAMDVRYLLALGRSDDRLGFASALKTDESADESLVALIVEKLAWIDLTPADIADLVHKRFSAGKAGFHIRYTLMSDIAERASDSQMYFLCRALVLKLARARQEGKRSRDDDKRLALTRARATDRYTELVTELLAQLVNRVSFTNHRRVAWLCLSLQRILTDAHASASELAELKRALQANIAVRRALLSMIVNRNRRDRQELWMVIYGYGSISAPTAADIAALNLDELTSLFREREAELAARPTQAQLARQIDDERLEISAGIRDQLLGMLEQLADGSGTNGLAWVAGWLLGTNHDSRYGEIDINALDRVAGSEIGLAVRRGFSRVWRTRQPAFKENEPHTTYNITLAGLQGLHIELGKGNHLPPLPDQEVRHAIRYAFFEINGFPKWFWPLIEAHQDIAEQELLEILKRAKNGAASREHAEEFMVTLVKAPTSLQSKLARLAWMYVRDEPGLRQYAAERILAAAIGIPGVVTLSEFGTTAQRKIKDAFKNRTRRRLEAQVREAEREASVVWASAWLTSYPATFVKMLKQWTNQDSQNARAFMLRFAAYLGREPGSKLIDIAKANDDGLVALGSLYELTIKIVRPEDDRDHADGEAYSPDWRDNAEQFRSSLIPAIAAAPSQLAYEILDRLRSTAVGTRANYLRSVQFQMREAQYAHAPLSQQKYNDFERDFVADVTDTTSFAMSIHSDLLAVKYDIERGEYSLRRFFSELISRRSKSKGGSNQDDLALEADFQRLLASELHHHSRNRYSVTVEPHTAEAKRRDVLCSKGSMFASIELKMSRRWSLQDYVDALRKQLVGKYMRHRRATAGFLVIVLQQKARTWNDISSGKKLGFTELLKTLQERALQLEAKDRRRYLRIIGIDATAPEEFSTSAKATLRNRSRSHKQRPQNIATSKTRRKKRTGAVGTARRASGRAAKEASYALVTIPRRRR